MLQENLAILTAIAEAVEHGGMPRIAMVVTSPLDVLTEYLRGGGRTCRCR